MGAHSEVQKPLFDFRRTIPVASGYALRRVSILNSYSVADRAAATVHIDEIIARGNYASLINVAGVFFVRELVLI